MRNREPLNPEYIPVWFHLPPRFYRILKDLANKSDMEMSEVLTESLRHFKQLSELAKRTGLSRTQCISEAARLIGKGEQPKRAPVTYRWERTSPEQRSQIARDLARQRWSKRDEGTSHTS